MNWYQMAVPVVVRELATDSGCGLTEAEATRRIAQHGRNELSGSGIRSPWCIVWEQLTALMVLILIVAAIVSALFGDVTNAIAIGAIVVLNAILGFSQEYRAEKAIAALRRLAAPYVKVRRGGQVREIQAFLLVPGDIILLEAGNAVAADGRLCESADLQTHEAALTGESEPIRKTTGAILDAELPLGDRLNMLYMGTFVTAGRGQAIVTETGMRTELGRIAALMHTADDEPTPLQRRLDKLGRRLAAAVLLLVAVIFALGLLRGEELRVMFLTAVSIGVAAVPEGLPAVVTIALTIGAQRMLAKRVLIRKLSAVETLGSVTVICSDKTGTLTENRMTVAALQIAGESLSFPPDLRTLPSERAKFNMLLAGAALCNDALLQGDRSGASSPIPLGDPTETALVVAASRIGLLKPELERSFPRIAEVPFSSERKLMTTVHSVPSDASHMHSAAGLQGIEARSPFIAFTKGAVDILLEISCAVWVHGGAEPLTQAWRDHLTRAHRALAGSGRRVLGVALRWLDSIPSVTGGTLEHDLIFIGMIGIADPLRSAVSSAVEKCKTAGIRPLMITGDHPLTAQYIAHQLGIADRPVITGQDLDRCSAAELEHVLESGAVFARVLPEHKLKIVQALQQSGEIVAVTGDGVNDAPALKKANIGVAMGMTGTDVAKEAADMVLLDDNFASIVDAVEEGRAIYDNLRKFIRYILATNSGEIWVMLAAPFLGMPLPLLPLQILWMNLVTDGLPAIALGVEPPEYDTMRRSPHPPNETIFARGLGRHVIWVGMLMAFLSLGTSYWLWRTGDSNWRTFLLTVLTLSQMAHVLAIRSEHKSLFQIGLMSNKPLLGAVSLTVILQLALVYVPFLQAFFRTTPLPLPYLMLALALSSAVFVAVEIEKWNWRRA
jgi:Ca2+-transporting ATPase